MGTRIVRKVRASRCYPLIEIENAAKASIPMNSIGGSSALLERDNCSVANALVIQTPMSRVRSKHSHFWPIVGTFT